MNLKGYQRKYLRSLAHHLKPIVFVGKNNLNDGVYSSINDAFKTHELIKIKFRNLNVINISRDISLKLKCDIIGVIGKIMILYKQQHDPDLRKIKIPKK